ncbi:hypothetical protein BsWGS_20269 [Bradybaena similaris]
MTGLTTAEALQKLHTEIDELLNSHEEQLRRTYWRRFLFHMQDKASSFTPLSFLWIFGMAVLLVVAASMEDVDRFPSGSRIWLITEAVFLLACIALNLVLLCLKLRKEHGKHIGLKRQLLSLLQEAASRKHWQPDSFPDPYIPLSPCISLQWCIRDGILVNVPHPLLVCGDVVVMRPGHVAPGRCQALMEDIEIQAGETYFSETPQAKGQGPQPRMPMSTKKFILKETPIIKNFRVMCQENPSKPFSFLENERHTVCNIWMERRFLPVTFLIFLAINTLRYVYIDNWEGHWSELILVLQVHGILPLVPVLLPLMWTVVNTFGQAHVFAAYEFYHSLQDLKDSTESFDSCSNISIEEAELSVTWRESLRSFWLMFTGMKPLCCPDFEMLHSLGSVTALCCVDKKGILSWPNPSAEKVFFFSSVPKRLVLEEDDDKADKEDKKVNKRKRRLKPQCDHDPTSNIEVLDLTHDTAKQKDAFGVVFDDPNWKDHLTALKPLGLCILLNTCNEKTLEWYTQFTDHVSCAAKDNKDTVAVVNRRCLCLLSREIGFTDDAVSVFTHEATLGVYRQVPAEEAEREKQNRARSFIQHKIPMPNQVSVIARDKLSGMCQLLTQGTADVVLDCCTDAWTGTDLQLLTEMDRKRVLDFYHRNSMVAYCTAFAYKPLPKPIECWSNDVYTELMESPSTTKVAHGEDVGVFLDADEDNIARTQRSHSMDSLLELSPTSSVEEFGIGQMVQSHQTFIGMVSLQYQARQDFVQLIDKLESACIRFVHFSKENEVRSRVFAEKMGLEAGWNCHVSLMATDSVSSDDSSCRNLSSLGNVQPSITVTSSKETDGVTVISSSVSNPHNIYRSREITVASLSVTSTHSVSRAHSAPSFVNTDEVQVKFARDPLPIVIDQDCGMEDNDLMNNADSASHLIDESHNQHSETTVLIAHGSKENVDKEEEDKDCHTDADTEEKKRLIPKGGQNLEVESEFEEDEEDFDVQSDSRYTSSYVTENTEDSLTGVLDNRNEDFDSLQAHLPRGIENIRPHLKNIDNVPLLVNLFTDCVPEATCEMVKIMQENGEVVIVVGSSLNMDNTAIFMQADCSISIEPLFPQVCACRPPMSKPWSEDEPTPVELASKLLSLPCPLLFRRQDKFKLVQLIMESRHYIFAMRNCFYLLLSCLLAVVLAQLVCCLLLLPPALTVQHVLWLVVVVVPALSLSLMGNPNEARTVGMATHKNINHINKQIIVEFFVQFCSRFLPSIIVAVVSFAVVLHSFCDSVPKMKCLLYDFRYEYDQSGYESINITRYTSWSQKFQGGLVLAQNIFSLYFVIFLVAISMSLVHWQDHLWQRLPFKNLVWSLTAGVLLVLQVIFAVADVYTRHSIFGSPLHLSDVHISVWVLGSLWPLVTISLNELAKKREIKLAVRRQRRARLDFDTKLGMNSPF